MKDFIEMQNHLKTLSVWKCDAGTERNLKKSSGKEKRGKDETYKFWSRLSSASQNGHTEALRKVLTSTASTTTIQQKMDNSQRQQTLPVILY